MTNKNKGKENAEKVFGKISERADEIKNEIPKNNAHLKQWRKLFLRGN